MWTSHVTFHNYNVIPTTRWLSILYSEYFRHVTVLCDGFQTFWTLVVSFSLCCVLDKKLSATLGLTKGFYSWHGTGLDKSVLLCLKQFPCVKVFSSLMRRWDKGYILTSNSKYKAIYFGCTSTILSHYKVHILYIFFNK